MIVGICIMFHHTDIQMNNFLKTSSLFLGQHELKSFAIVNTAVVKVTGSIPYFKYKEIEKVSSNNASKRK